MAKKDYYAVLGIEKTAEDAEIKKAYKRLAMKYHPDRNAGDKKAAEEKFKEIQEAYSVLSDTKKRAAYDQFGHAGLGADGAGFGGGNPFSDIGGFGDIFSDIFGRQARPDNRGADLQYDLQVGFKEAIKGGNVKIRIPRNVPCKNCSGTGAKPGSRITTCSRCGGGGQVQIQQGFFAVQQPCPRCGGSGQQIESPCHTCSGSGIVREQKTLSVKIPPGINNGNRIRLAGEGEAGARGGASGDLYVRIHIKPDKIFAREGNHLLCSVPIDFATATLGGSAQVPGIDGSLKLKIPAGTQSGKMFRLRGKGAPSLRGGAAGDLLCEVKVETPVNLNTRQKKLLREFADSCERKHHPQSQTFFDKMRSYF